MSMLLYVVFGLTLLVVLVAVVVIGISRRMVAHGEALIRAHFTPAQVVRADPVAQFFGLESQDVVQLRGYGALVLTHEVLWFSQFMKNRELVVSRASLLEVKAVPGKAVGRGLLHVRFQSPTGEDAAAFFVHDLDGWQADLGHPPPPEK